MRRVWRVVGIGTRLTATGIGGVRRVGIGMTAAIGRVGTRLAAADMRMIIGNISPSGISLSLTSSRNNWWSVGRCERLEVIHDGSSTSWTAIILSRLVREVLAARGALPTMLLGTSVVDLVQWIYHF